jgi:hypothetical protein
MNRMNIIFTAILEGAKKHGIVFLVLLAIILYFQKQNEKLEHKFDLCNSQVIQMYQDHNTQLIQALNRNSAALERIAPNEKE